MCHARKAIFVGSLLTAVVAGYVDRAAALVTETYLFRDSFASIEGAGNVLVPVSNATRTIVTDGPAFLSGSFVTETISASACPSMPTVRAWAFPEKAGLRHENTSPTVVAGSYSISMLMRYNPMDTGYARLIDFSNSTLDTGIYKLGNLVSFYPVGRFAAGSFVQGQDVFVTITRDAATKLVSLYINGVASGTYTDRNDLYAPSATVMYFLMDNTTGSFAISETDPGVIAYLQVRDTPMSPEQVVASLSTICGAVACGDGTLAGEEACDDGDVLSGDGCSATCTVEECWECMGEPSACTPLALGSSCATDDDPCTEDVCDGAGSCGVSSCGSSTTTSTVPTTTTATTTTLPTCGDGHLDANETCDDSVTPTGCPDGVVCSNCSACISCPVLSVATQSVFAGSRVRVSVSLNPGSEDVAAMNFTACYPEGFTAGISLVGCGAGESSAQVGADVSCLTSDPPVCVTAAVLNRATIPVPSLPPGGVVELEFDVPPGVAGSYPVCLDAKSVRFGSPDGPDVCVGQPVCGRLDVVPGCRQGDCNCDGVVNAGDRVCLVTKFFEPEAQCTCGCEDCNLSGELNAADAPCITLCAFGQCPTITGGKPRECP